MYQLSQIPIQRVICTGSACFLYKLNFNTTFRNYAHTGFIESDLSGSIIEYCDLRNVNFRGSNLENARFINSNLIDVNFDYANLTNVFFIDCIFIRVKMFNAIKFNTQFIRINYESDEVNNSIQINAHGPQMPIDVPVLERNEPIESVAYQSIIDQNVSIHDESSDSDVTEFDGDKDSGPVE
jgi:hypothetical protein